MDTMDMPLLNTLVHLEDTLVRLLHRINETRAQQHQLEHDPGLLSWQTAVTLEQPGPLSLLPPLDPALSEVEPRDWCRICGVREGMVHKEGCREEICPNCTYMVYYCECLFAPGALGQPRVPFFAEPPYCCYRCKVSIPPIFRVPNAVWRAYVPPHWHKKVLCLECFVYIIRVTDQATPPPASLLERWVETWRREATDGAYIDDTTV